MIIKSLEMKNYRPYRQPPKINFAYGDKNLTIIEGDNDLGKTTLLSAISWCLFNADERYKKHSKPMCNLEASKELNIDAGSISKCCNGERKQAGGYIWKYKVEEEQKL